MSKSYPQGYSVVFLLTLFCVCLLGIEGWRNWSVRLDELRTMHDRGEELAKLAAQRAIAVPHSDPLSRQSSDVCPASIPSRW